MIGTLETRQQARSERVGRSRKKAAARKASAAGMPELAPVERRTKEGRLAWSERPEEDPRTVALAARCHHLGIGTDRDSRRAAKAEWLGCDLGRVMDRLCRTSDGDPDPIDAARLWSVWQGWCAAERTYRLRYIGQTGEAKGAAIAMLPEKMQADTGHTIDTRTAEERDRDAVAVWMRWQGYLGMLPTAHHAAMLHQARREDGPPLWIDRSPTVQGRATLRALRLFADLVERKKGA